MKIKSIISFLLVFVIILLNYSSFVYSVEDTTAPIIVSVSKDKETVNVGEIITFTVEFDDDFSGTESFYIEWQLNGDNTKNISKQFYNITKKIDNYEFIIPNNTPAGNYQAIYVPLYDYAGNNRAYYRYGNEELLSSFDFTVVDSNQDTTPPVVSNFKIISKDITAPGEIIVQYDVKDDLSGVKEHAGGLTYSPISNLSHECIMNTRKVGENTYQSTIYIESIYDKFIFKYIQVKDNAGNCTNYTKEDLGIVDDIYFAGINYIEDKNPPKISNIEYNKTKFNIPDQLEVLFDIEDGESGFNTSLGKAYFKAEDENIKGNIGVQDEDGNWIQKNYLYEECIRNAVNSDGLLQKNKAVIKHDFNESEKFRGNIYLDRIEINDKAGNKTVYSVEDNTLEKNLINISKIEKQYTLVTSTIVEDYIEQISNLPEGSTVLVNVIRKNQIIKKELFDVIKGRNIEITFTNIYGGSSSQSGGEISSETNNMGIQWIINGRDIVNETKDINMKVELSVQRYSKYYLPEYELNENLELDYWDSLNLEDATDEDFMEYGEALIPLQKQEIEKYFNKLKQDGYLIEDEVYKNIMNLLEENIGIDCKGAIINGSKYVKYISIKFADNGELPCITKVRLKPDYATRGLIGAKGLNLYYINGSEYILEENNIDLDEENYYNFNLTHNSEFALLNGKMEKLEKSIYELGDVNKDGAITAKDATMILKSLAKKITLTEEEKALADTDRDGNVKASDAVKILKYVARKITEF